MGRPGSAPVTQNVAASEVPPPTASSIGRAAVSAVGPHQGAGSPLVPGRAASPARANRARSVQSLFQDHPYSGPVSASPGVPVPSQRPVMASSYGQNNFTAASGPASATTVYQKDGFGRFVPIGPVVSAVDNNVCRMQAFPVVQGVVSAAPGFPVVYHVPSMEIYAAQGTSALLCAASVPLCSTPVNNEVSAMSVLPAFS